MSILGFSKLELFTMYFIILPFTVWYLYYIISTMHRIRKFIKYQDGYRIDMNGVEYRKEVKDVL